MASVVPSLSCWPVVFSNPALAVWTSTHSPPPLSSPSLSPLSFYPPYLHHGRSIESGFDVVLSLFRPRLSFKPSCSSVSHSRPSLRIGHWKRTRIICTFKIRSLLPLPTSHTKPLHPRRRDIESHHSLFSPLITLHRVLDSPTSSASLVVHHSPVGFFCLRLCSG